MHFTVWVVDCENDDDGYLAVEQEFELLDENGERIQDPGYASSIENLEGLLSIAGDYGYDKIPSEEFGDWEFTGIVYKSPFSGKFIADRGKWD